MASRAKQRRKQQGNDVAPLILIPLLAPIFLGGGQLQPTLLYVALLFGVLSGSFWLFALHLKKQQVRGAVRQGAMTHYLKALASQYLAGYLASVSVTFLLFTLLAFLPSLHTALVILSVAAVLILAVYWWFRFEQQKRDGVLKLDIEKLSPYEFEQLVTSIFSALPGWKAEVTQASGDQGADVIAVSPQKVRYVVQVKKYTVTVGNKAVQEVVAAKAYYRATEAIVVTSGPGFTKAAQDLALVNAVHLWTQAELLAMKKASTKKQPVPAWLLPTLQAQ